MRQVADARQADDVVPRVNPPFGRHHRGLPAAIGMPAGKDASLRPLSHGLHSPSHAFAIARLSGEGGYDSGDSGSNSGGRMAW